MATAGSSAEGSRWAMLPPIVPRLRVWRWPTCRIASCMIGQRVLTTSENSISRWRVMPPIFSAPFDASMPLSPSTLLRSITWSGST